MHRLAQFPYINIDYLWLLEPATHIIGAPDMYIESGSTINLTCIIEDSPEPPAYIFWNHNNAVCTLKSSQTTHCSCSSWETNSHWTKFNSHYKFQIITYESPRGGVSVITKKEETTTSYLLIKNARPSDSGQYQCNPSNAKSRSVTVHVLNGKYAQKWIALIATQFIST